ncbi:MAG: hypothetical protein Q9207_004851 [Kuettlingeria erythrocarpa]
MSFDSNSTVRQSTPTFLNPRSPPLPPPKSRPPPSPPHPSSQQRHAETGPPLPPPPPTSTQAQGSQQSTPRAPPQSSAPQPPSPAENWLPEILLDKPTSALQPVFSDSKLLTSFALQHPSLTPSPLPPHLSQTQHLAQHLQSQHAALLHLRHQTQTRLLHLHALERQWRQKQSEVDARLEPWSAKNLYQRLVAREREGDDWCRGLEESFLDEGGEKVGEREVGEFVKRYREGRRGVGRRREERARWDEGRVGGWR